MADISLIVDVVGEKDMVAATRAAEKMRREYAHLDREFNQGRISAQQYAKGVQQIDARIDSLSFAHKQARSAVDAHTQAIKGNTGALATQAMAAQRSSKGMKHFASIGLQQVGYQFSDFAVQVQSGTSALVAFGQQGSQLAGLLFLLPGMFGAVAGAVVSIAIPAFTALGNVFFNLQSEADSLEDAMESLKAVASSVDTALGLHEESIITLIDKYGLLAGAVREASFQVARNDIIEMGKEINDVVLPSFEDLQETFNRMEERPILAPQKFAGLAEDIGLSVSQAEDLAKALNAFDQADSLERKAVTAANLASVLSLIPDEVLETNGRLREAVSGIQALIGPLAIAKEAVSDMNNASPSQSWMNDAIKGVNSLISRIAVAISGMNTLKGGVEQTTYRGGRGTQYPTFDEIIRNDPRAQLFYDFQGNLNTGTLGDTGGNSVASGASAAADQVDRLNQALTENEKLMLSVGETVASSFGDALMSIVDGSKSAADAFRDMARKILKQAFDMLVVQPIMNSIMGIFSPGPGMSMGAASSIVSQLPQALVNANGNVFQGGKHITAYANGGVVNGATAFAHSGGLGVMGEAGPEAIMPLKRGKNGKLGVSMEGSQESPVNVYQTININGNGDEYIMGKIQQAAPQLANYTQQQMLDQRRRGGVVKSTFG